MRKILLTSVLVCIVFSAFADDPVYITDGSKCTNATTGTTGGNISLRTVYQPKSIPITWESNGTTYTTSTCTYDTQLQMPVAPTRLGYTFDGWTLEEACSLSNLDTSIGGDKHACIEIVEWEGSNCSYNENPTTYGLTVPGQWAVPFSYGTVFGMAKCGAKNGDNHDYQWGGNSADWTSDATTLDGATGEKTYCWCSATAYTPSGGNQCQLSSSSWVFPDKFASSADCAGYCADSCAKYVGSVSAFRVALFRAAQ